MKVREGGLMASRNRNRAIRRIPHTAMFGALVAALPLGAQAARLNYDLSLRYMHSDNIVLQETGEISEDVLSPQLRFEFAHDTSTVTANLRGDVQYLDYLDDVYDDDTRGEFTGQLDWTIVPERITFAARDTLSEQSVSSLAAFTPGNQQQINVFEAGPTFLARFGDAMRGQLDFRYTNSWAEETESFNSDRYNVAARLLRLLSDTDALVFNLEASQTEYDTIAELYDYKRYDGYVTYRSQLSRLDLNIDAGYSRLEPEGVDSTSSVLFRGYMGWQVAPRSLLSANLDYQFGDASQDLIQRVGAPGEPVDPNDPGGPIIGQPGDPNLQIIPDTFKQKRANLNYEFTGERLTLLAQPYYEQLRYLRDDTFDANNYGVSVTAVYALNQRTRFSAVAQRYDREFDNIDRDDTDTILGAGVAMRFSRHWGAQFDYRHRKRDSSVGGQNYTENVVVLSITYFR